MDIFKVASRYYLDKESWGFPFVCFVSLGNQLAFYRLLLYSFRNPWIEGNTGSVCLRLLSISRYPASFYRLLLCSFRNPWIKLNMGSVCFRLLSISRYPTCLLPIIIVQFRKAMDRRKYVAHLLSFAFYQ